MEAKIPGSVLRHPTKATIGEIRFFNDEVAKIKLLLTTQMLRHATEYHRYPRDDSEKTEKELQICFNDSKIAKKVNDHEGVLFRQVGKNDA